VCQVVEVVGKLRYGLGADRQIVGVTLCPAELGATAPGATAPPVTVALLALAVMRLPQDLLGTRLQNRRRLRKVLCREHL
jgi:hypothetical protein